MPKMLRFFFLLMFLFFTSGQLKAQCHFIPSTSASIDTVSYIFSGGGFGSYGCAPVDPTYWLQGNGIYILATFVNPEDYPSFRVWGMNDDDSASVEVNGVSYPLDLVSASYEPKVVCGISPGPDGVYFVNGKVVGSNTNGMGNYSYSDITINTINVTSIRVTGTNGAGWGFAGISVDCQQLPQALIGMNPVQICPGTCTDYNNLSINATSFLWTFSGANPSTSTDVNPTNICYNAPGNYPVSLIASNASGSDTLLLNNFVTVYPYPPPQGIIQNGDTLFGITGATSYQWYYNGLPISGATDYFYVVLASGDYSLVATDANGCEVEAVSSGVELGLTPALFNDVGVKVYPSPVKDILTIDNISFNESKLIDIPVFNLTSQKVLSTQQSILNNQSTMSVDLSSLDPGIYFLLLHSGDKNFRIKFIKN